MNGISSYKFYVDGQLVGTMPVTTTWNSAPECGSSGAVTFQVALGEASSKTVKLDVTDQDDANVIDATGTVKAGECLKKGL